MTCEFCEKTGLPVLPVRYAVAPEGGASPAVAAPFGGSDTKIDMAPARYGMRILRTGYLYVYDEARKRWDAYFITPTADYYKLDLKKPTPPAGKMEFICPRGTDGLLASCITIENPKKATKVWFGFSDVEWTEKTFVQHEDEATRKKHMRCFDVAAWMTSKSHKHAQKIDQVESCVAEYALDDEAGEKEFVWSPFLWQGRKSFAKGLCAKAQYLAPDKGVILALQDASGIVQDLAKYMNHLAVAFLSHPSRMRKFSVSSSILTLKGNIAEQARLQELAAADTLRDQQYVNEASVLDLFSDKKTIEKRNARIDQTFTVTKEGLEKVAKDSWGKYEKKYNETERDNFHKDFQKKLAAFDQTTIAPLSAAHVAWMKSSKLSDYTTSVFDTTNIASGCAYEKLVTMCIEDTSDKGTCATLYLEWLKGDITDPKNHVLRALALNNDKLAEGIQNGATSAITLKNFPWDNLFETFKTAVDKTRELVGATWEQKILNSGNDNLSRYLLQLSGPLARFGNQAFDAAGKPLFKSALAVFGAMGMRIGKPIITVSIEGSKKQLRAQLIKQLIRLNGQLVNSHQINKAVADQMRLLQIEGISLEGNTKRLWIVPVDEAHIKGMPAGLTPGQRALWAAKALATVEHVEQASQTATRAMYQKLVNLDVKLGAVTLICQLIGLKKAADDDAGSMQHEKKENSMKLIGANIAIAGTLVEIVGESISKTAWGNVPLARGMSYARVLGNITRSRFMVLAGKFIGAGAAAISAFFDFKHAYEEVQRDNDGMALLFFMSGAIGLAVTIGLLFSWAGPVMLILIAVFVALTIIVELVKDNKIQEWLKRSFFGTDTANRYDNSELEMNQLKVAIS